MAANDNCDASCSNLTLLDSPFLRSRWIMPKSLDRNLRRSTLECDAVAEAACRRRFDCCDDSLHADDERFA